jgi:hypothetical protein
MDTAEAHDQTDAAAARLRNALIGALGPRNRRVMKRCFMTGKQCIFASHVAEGLVTTGQTGPVCAFVAMPFSPDLETCYRWSLRPFLTRGYGLSEGLVRRADDVRDIGAIVCEKICRRIQESDFVLVDVSLPNANVFYEMGLAVGLDRPLVLMRNAGTPGDVLADACVRESLGLSPHAPGWAGDPVLEYPGVGRLDANADAHRLDRKVHRPREVTRSAGKLEISILTIRRPGMSQRQDPSASHGSAGKQTIRLQFTDVLQGAVGVAMDEMRSDSLNGQGLGAPPWAQVVQAVGDDAWDAFKSAKTVELNGQSGFAAIASAIESSFCTVIDVSENDPVAYYWLGYCHARGLNAIPVYRRASRRTEIAADATLAFDIRALWYAEYYEDEPYEFKTKMREILEHLLARDIPDRQKRAFWARFPAERKLRVFTGAVHVENLNREVVGDWDVRTVSELFSYLSSVSEGVAAELVAPVYSPEEAYRREVKSQPAAAAENATSSRQQFIANYRGSIEEQLRSANAIVIASPDVNPVTEYLLHRIYGVKTPAEPFETCRNPEFSGYVVVKKLPRAAEAEARSATAGPGSSQEFPRLFFRKEEGEAGQAAVRGFGDHLRTVLDEPSELLEKYLSQDECRGQFFLLGHLLISRYPPKQKGGSLVVLLNGVSGPATFALAQILTGGGLHGSPEMNANSESMLQEINQVLDETGCIGVEAIVKVELAPAEDSATKTYLDSRRVVSWSFVAEKEYKLRALRQPH